MRASCTDHIGDVYREDFTMGGIVEIADLCDIEQNWRCRLISHEQPP